MNLAGSPADADRIRDRVAQIVAADRNTLHKRIDRMFAVLLALQWPACVVAALAVSPSTWIGSSHSPHIHVWASILLGLLINVLPIALVFLRPGHVVTRHTIAIAQMAWSSLLIHVSGGRIETHFHIFGSLAFLAFYRDWRVLMGASALVAIDHIVRGAFWPQSVFGVMSSSHWRWIEHAAWVAFEDIFLILACRSAERDALVLATRQAQVEDARDRTEAVVQERTRDLVAANQAAINASRAKSEFLANMSHEIRTPMTAILGYADLMKDPAIDTDTRREHLTTIERNGRHLLVLINDILDLSKIEAGRMEVEHIHTRPIDVIHEVLDLMALRFAQRGIWLEFCIDTPVPASISSDPVRLKQIVLNLLGNALKFTERGGVRVRVSLDTAKPAAPSLRISVADTGIGINPAQLDALFAPFSQADTSTTRRYGGTGLGLRISRSLAQLLGGDITVTSTPALGSEFVLEVATGNIDGVPMIEPRSTLVRPAHAPIQGLSARSAPNDLPTPAAIAPAARPPQSALPEPPLKGVRVVLAEDGADNQRLLGFFLRKAGAEVRLFENGKLALNAMALDQTHDARNLDNAPAPCDIVITDMQMPVMDGYSFARALRALGWRGPILALTANAMQGDERACIEAGCDRYLAKPVAAPDLVDACSELLRATSGSGAHAA